MNLVYCIVMMSGCVVYTSCLSSSCLFVMPFMFTCSMDMLVARDVLIGLCGVFWVLVQVLCCVPKVRFALPDTGRETCPTKEWHRGSLW